MIVEARFTIVWPFCKHNLHENRICVGASVREGGLTLTEHVISYFNSDGIPTGCTRDTSCRRYAS